MPRPERPVDPSEGPVQRFAADLRRLREAAGGPPYRELAKTAHFSKATLSAAAAGHRLPTWEVTRAYVRACGADTEEWQDRWQRVRTELGVPVPVPDEGEPPHDGAGSPPRRAGIVAAVVLAAGAVVLVAVWSLGRGHSDAASAAPSSSPSAASTEPLGRFVGGKQPVADDNDPKKTGCAYDSGVVTVDRVEVNTGDEHYLGEAELRYAPRCDVLWGRFTPSAGMDHLGNAQVTIAAARPATGTAGVPYTTRFDGQAIFGNILTDRRGCVRISVIVRSAAGRVSATTACKP